MLITTFIEINMRHNKNKKQYDELGYDTSGLTAIISLTDLPKNSHFKVQVKCDVCGTEKIIGYNKYNKNIKSHNIYACCNKCAQIKNKITSIEKFGCEHHSKTKSHRDKVSITSSGIFEEKWEIRNCKYCNTEFKTRKKNNRKLCSINCAKQYAKTEEFKKNTLEHTESTILKKYGVKNVFSHPAIIEKIRQTRIERGIEIPFDKLSEWQKYNRIVRKLTLRNRKKLFDQWDGYDYYDKQYIKHFLLLNYTKNEYPTVDHKISLHYGFMNNIIPTIIADIDNLCITKRIINSIKRIKTSD